LDPDAVRRRAAVVLERARARFADLPVVRAYPPGADAETKEFVRYWFDPYARRQLAALADSVRRVHEPAERRALWCAFSRLIITKQSGASRAMDLSHSRPHKKFEVAPTKPFNKFLEAVETVVTNVPHRRSGKTGPAVTTTLGDARRLPIRSGSVDLVLTSPPYLNAIDYMRCSKFSLAWMGYSLARLRRLRGRSIGAEVSLSPKATKGRIEEIIRELRLRPRLQGRDAAIFARYIKDMDASLREVARILTAAGQAIYVVGNSSVHGTFVRNSAVVEAVAIRNGLRLIKKRTRSLPPNRRYLPPPAAPNAGATFSSRMRQEVVLSFKRAA
ncbi:MAG: hypothetical protein JNG83_07060, partial [Opitutaceae bacterium]|nr:hypothetical protein [Opitutaceae bacterium]